MKGNLISDTELQTYVDGFLREERRQAVEAELLCNPSLQSEVAIWQKQNETLRALYAPGRARRAWRLVRTRFSG
jgi:anti-sigma factor RsiW